MARVVVLGGGVGGTAVANRLARAGGAHEIIVVDSHGDHLYQPALVRVPLDGERVRLAEDERRLLRPEATLVVDRVRAVDPDHRCVRLESGSALGYDVLVLASGCRMDHSRIPGAKEASHNFHCRRSARRLGEALRDFQGGRIVVGAAALPYKFPPSPIEFILLLEDWLRERGLRGATSLCLFSPTADLLEDAEVSRRLRPLLEERDIDFRTSFQPVEVEPGRRVIRSERAEIPFDLLVLVPPHVSQPYVRTSGLADADGWARPDPRTLRLADRIYALGDTATLPCPKTGSAARLQARTVAENVLKDLGEGGEGADYDGEAPGLLETGRHRAMPLDYGYGRPATAGGPSRLAYWKKLLLGRFYFRLARR